MRRALLLCVLSAPGCDKPPQTPPSAGTGPPVVTKQVIEAGRPEFETMLAEFKANPKTKKFEREIVTFIMTVQSVKQVDKETYEVMGAGPGVNLVCTFPLPPNLAVNDRVKTLAPGDKLTYWAEPADYRPGTPPTITSLSGSFMAVERAKK